MQIKDVIKTEGRFVIGMVHCLPLPGTTGFSGDLNKIYEQAVQDALTLESAGVDAVIVENMGDGPFGVELEEIQRTALAVATEKVCQAVKIPVGVDAAFCDWQADLNIAYATGCKFIRVPVFVDMVEFYGGIIEPCARQCMRYRHSLGADDILVLADVHVKHTTMVFPDHSHEMSAAVAESCGADGIIVTGPAIATEAPIDTIKRVKEKVSVPVIAGSGVTPRNIVEQLNIADGAIVGSSLKKGGVLSGPISYDLCRELLAPLGR